jgi:hypothetical protein
LPRSSASWYWSLNVSLGSTFLAIISSATLSSADLATPTVTRN